MKCDVLVPPPPLLYPAPHSELMTRQRRLADPDRLTWVRVQYYSLIKSLNGWWRRCAFDHGGQAVFTSAGRFLYFRPRLSNGAQEGSNLGGGGGGGGAWVQGRWVIDDAVRVVGLPYSASLTAALTGPWASSRRLASEQTRAEIDLTAVAVTYRPSNRDGESAVLHGFPGGLGLNGTYRGSGLVISGRPHLVKSASDDDDNSGGVGGASPFGPRRHLFFSAAEKAWAIAARCDDTEGLIAVSAQVGNWSAGQQELPEEGVMHFCILVTADGAAAAGAAASFAEGADGATALLVPGLDLPEPDLAITPLTAREAADQFGQYDRDAVAGPGAAGGGGGSGDLGGSHLGDLVPWEASNHEALLVATVGPGRGGLRFLCSRPTHVSLHPELQGLLDRHLVNLGAASGTGHSSASSGGGEGAELLALLGEVTDVPRTEGQETLALAMKSGTGGRYVLTADTLLKALAIVARLRCGVPVILLGECGCGKTALLRYLGSWLDVELEVREIMGQRTRRGVTVTAFLPEPTLLNSIAKFG